MADRMALGRLGEERAAAYLQRKGYKILERNFRCARGEVDIIAQQGNRIIFVEVKTRRNLAFGLPREAVSRQKRRHIALASASYFQRLAHAAAYESRFAGNPPDLEKLEFRMDVIEVLVKEGQIRIRHLENAFGI